MSKLIIWVSGRPIIYGYQRQDFKWSVPHNCFIYLGRELEEKEFNDVIDKVLSRHKDKNPSIKVMLTAPVADELPPDEVPSFGQESEDLRLKRALEIVQQLAPDMIKKKPGRKPEPVMV
jgi:hypothetical protein